MQTCNICNHSEFKTITVKKTGKEYFKCSYCDYIFLNSTQIITQDKEKKRYLNHNNTIENKGYLEMFDDFIAKCINPFINLNNCNALDFGCGHVPVLAELLKNKGAMVNYYDLFFYPNPQPLAQKYSLITSTEVLEHLKNPCNTIKQLVKILNKGGVLAVSTMFYPPNIQDFINWWYIRDETHISFFNKKTMYCIAKKLKLNVILLNERNYCVFKK